VAPARPLIAALSRGQLKHMGLSRANARRESPMPFWRE
jgi:uncharacterized protein YjiS (DUF1127 family)